MSSSDESQRRAYWRHQMDEAYAFMCQMRDYPVNECGESFADLRAAAAAAEVVVCFSDTKVVDDFDRIYWLRASLVADLIAAARTMNERGWVLTFEDGYRSSEIQRRIGLQDNIFDVVLQRVIWECEGKVPSPELMFRRMSALIATNPKVGTHVSGTAVDVSVHVLEAGAAGAELDRGGPYLELSELTPMASPFVSAEAQRNRAEITAALKVHGFMAYPYEFWHYNKGDAYDAHLNRTGKPARYGPVHFDSATGRTEPIEAPETPLHTMEAIQTCIDRALANQAVRSRKVTARKSKLS